MPESVFDMGKQYDTHSGDQDLVEAAREQVHDPYQDDTVAKIKPVASTQPKKGGYYADSEYSYK